MQIFVCIVKTTKAKRTFQKTPVILPILLGIKIKKKCLSNGTEAPFFFMALFLPLTQLIYFQSSQTPHSKESITTLPCPSLTQTLTGKGQLRT